MSPQIERFAAAVMSDRALQFELMAFWEPRAFAARAVEMARALGTTLDEKEVLVGPNGAAPVLLRAMEGRSAPPAGWLPVRLVGEAGAAMLDWLCFDGIDLGAPFFQQAFMGARVRPFNRLFQWRTRLSDLVPMAAEPPAGLIFHLSRCGSTLVHRMLGPLANSLSEVPVFDQAVQLCQNWNGPENLRHAPLLAIAGALGNIGNGRPLILKLETPHILSWPLIRRAFPQTPAIFLCREPVEILVSQRRVRGFPGVPQPAIAALCRMDDYSAFSLDEYYAHMLAAACRAAAVAAQAGELRVINYRELPDAVFTQVLPHFGLHADEAALGLMRQAAGFNAKLPDERFLPDGEEKQRAAGEELHALAERIVGPSYRALEALSE